MDDKRQHPGDMEEIRADRRDERGRGRHADRPQQIPKRGWFDILKRVKREVAHDNLSLVAAGLAFYAMLAVFPALTATVAIYGMFASPADIASHLDQATAVMPEEAAGILQTQMQELSRQQDQALSIGAIIGLLIALWSARQGMTAIMTATNIAYDEEERRGFFKQIFVSLALTLGAVIGFIILLALAVALPLALSVFNVHPILDVVVRVVRWAVLWFLVVAGLGIVYRYAPSRDKPRWRWVTAGSAVAATLWLVASLLFSFYVSSFASYNETYGALGGVVVLLLWLYISAFVIILGAEINAEMERQTARDTTSGAERPMGERGAYAADTIGR